jgi:hypothetical protein
MAAPRALRGGRSGDGSARRAVVVVVLADNGTGIGPFEANDVALITRCERGRGDEGDVVGGGRMGDAR